MKSGLHRTFMGVVFLLAGYISSVAAQSMTLAGGGPRFLYASSHTARPIEIEVSRNVVLRQQVRLTFDHPTVGDILESITEQTGFSFVYSRELIPVDRPVRLHAESISLAAALTEILVDTGADVLLSPGYQIALVRKPSPLPDTTGAVTGKVQDSAGHPLEGAIVSVEGARISVVTNAEGTYWLANVPSGDRVIAFRLIGYQRITRNIHLSPATTQELNVTLRATPTVLEEIVTTGSLIPTEVKALPTPITIVTSQEIELLHPRRLDDLVRLAVPGAVAWETSGDAGNPGGMGLAFRGASSLFLSVDQGSSNPKIFLDGIEITGGGYGYYPDIDPTSIERVEIVRGPQASAIYGSDAMGGVIQIFTKKGVDGQPIRLDAQAALGSIQSSFPESGALRQEYSAGITGSAGSASFRVGGGYRRTGDWMPALKENSPHVSGSVRMDEGPLTVALNTRYEVNTSERGLNKLTNPLIGTPYCNAGCSSPGGFRTTNRLQQIGLSAGVKVTPWWSNEIVLGIDQTNLVSNKYKRTVGDSLFSYSENMDTRKSIAYRSTLNGVLTGALVGTVIAGVDHYSNISTLQSTYGLLSLRPFRLSPTGSSSNFYSRRTNTGIFTQGQLALNDQWFAVGSIRKEDNSEFGQNVSWPSSTRFGVTHVRDLSRDLTLKLRASYGQAIRPPSGGARDSVYYGPTSIQLPNPDLKEQRQFGPDMGFDLVFGGHGSLGVTYYHQIARDFQYFSFSYNAETGDVRYKNINLARVKNDGWEIEGALTTRLISGRATFGITHSKPTDLGVPPTYMLQVGKQLWGIPEHTATAAISVSPFQRTTLTVSAAYRSGTETTDQVAAYECQFGTGPCLGDPDEDFDYGDYTIKLPAVTKFGAAVDQYFTRNLSAFLNIEDLTNTGSDRAINNYSQLPGRITTVGVRMRY